jgi:molybdenum transport protein
MKTLPDHTLQAWLEDDVPCGDLSTHALGIGAQPAQLEFRARQAMTVCATEEAARLFDLVDAQAQRVVASGFATTQAADDPLRPVLASLLAGRSLNQGVLTAVLRCCRC